MYNKRFHSTTKTMHMKTEFNLNPTNTHARKYCGHQQAIGRPIWCMENFVGLPIWIDEFYCAAIGLNWLRFSTFEERSRVTEPVVSPLVWVLCISTKGTFFCWISPRLGHIGTTNVFLSAENWNNVFQLFQFFAQTEKAILFLHCKLNQPK